jgi:hypothetical protein
MPYEKPVVRDYGDVAEVTAVAVGGDVQDDGVIKSSDVISVAKGGASVG